LAVLKRFMDLHRLRMLWTSKENITIFKLQK
jgi:hypothetical protein